MHKPFFPNNQANVFLTLDGVVSFLILTVAEEVTAIICSSLPVVLPFLYQQYKNSKKVESRKYGPAPSSKGSNPNLPLASPSGVPSSRPL